VQGVFRDLDAFAMGGVGLAIPAAFAIGIAFRDRLLPAWIAPALLLAVVVPSLQWLMHFHDPAHGIVRARSFALEPPARGDGERARLWDALAYRAFRLQQWDQAVEATGQSARLAPHPRALMMQAIANTYAGHHHEAERIYLDLVTRAPDDPLAWVGLGGAALRVGDSLQIRRALAELETYTPESAEARAIRRHLTAFPEVWPAGEGAGAPR
jgi:tetratricopeptide (TPR) repeat protein